MFTPAAVARYTAILAAIAAVDGALLGGIAAIITSLGGIALGLMAYSHGANRTNGDGWRALADLVRENEQLRAENEQLRKAS